MCKLLTVEDVRSIRDPLAQSLAAIDKAIKEKAMDDATHCDFEVPDRGMLYDVVSSLEERGFTVHIDRTYVYSQYIVITVSW